MSDLLCHLRRELAHFGQALDGNNLVLFTEVVEHQRCPAGVKVSQHKGNGLRVFCVEELAELLWIGPLQLGQVTLGFLLRAPHQHQQIVRALLAEGLLQKAAGVVQAPMDHEALRLQQFPELLQYLAGHFGADAAQVGQLLGEALHVHLGQGAQNLLGQLLTHGNQQNGRFAQSRHVRRFALYCCPALNSPLGQGAGPFCPSTPVALLFFVNPSTAPGLFRVNPALQKARTLRRLPLEMAGNLVKYLLSPLPLGVKLGRLGRAQDGLVQLGRAAGQLPDSRSFLHLSEGGPHTKRKHHQNSSEQRHILDQHWRILGCREGLAKD